uniref:tRNA dimethylallyltransferase n=1 Tax=Mycena chlorophos TaxID=658473 RepID=A0ABQ0M2J3_MYCCL|nr:tRNA isopentenyltransferase [Mycena chlorophos]
MQVYAGLDVLTNKVPEAEQQGVPHLLMGFKHPGEQYLVGQWVKDAINAIDESHRNNQVPIVVGGTSYWMYHLIFPDRLSQHAPIPMSDTILASLASLPPELRELFNSLPSQQAPDAALDPDAAARAHRLLQALDPQMAARWHWKDTRKVFRSLCILKDTGRRPSDIVSEQSETVLKSRYDTLCLWLYAEPTALHPRLDDRVDDMLDRGLLDEVRALRRISEANESDYTLGIYQSIGYREFHGYLTASAPADNMFREAVENMKTSTRQYAKRQISWIRNKLLPAVHAAEVPTYLLNATRIDENWANNVRDPAISIARRFLDSVPLPDPSSLSPLAATLLQGNVKSVDPAAVLCAQRKVVCESCTSDASKPFLVEESQLEAHRHSRSHRRSTKKMTPEEHRAANFARFKAAAVVPTNESVLDGISARTV